MRNNTILYYTIKDMLYFHIYDYNILPYSEIIITYFIQYLYNSHT